MFNWVRKGVSKLNEYVNKPMEKRADNLDWLELELADWLKSPARKDQIKGDMYYNGKQEILKHKRYVIGKDGEKVEVKNLPNEKKIDNQYARLVNQKTNHLVGKAFTVDSENDEYVKKLKKQYFNKRFTKLLKAVGKDVQNGGISYIYPYYEDNKLKFKHMKSYNVKVYWKDDEHEEIDFFWHYYKEAVRMPNGTIERIEHLEVYTMDGVRYYYRNRDNGTLLYDSKKGEKGYSSYLHYVESNGDEVTSEENLMFDRIPLIPFRINETEQPLLNRVKSLQDGINTILSTFTNNMLEDSRNTILILVNYDGQNLGEFREKLAQYGAVKVRSMDGGNGDVRALNVEVNAENYKLIVDLFKKAIIQNGGGVDVTELRSAGNPNQMNIQSMYYDIEIDTNDTETEFQCAMEKLLWFINFDLNYQGEGDFFEEEIDIIFNRDMLQDETTIIDNIMKVRGLISDEDCIRQLPFGNAQKLIDNMKKQKEAEQDEYMKTFMNNPNPNQTDTQNNAGGALNE